MYIRTIIIRIIIRTIFWLKLYLTSIFKYIYSVVWGNLFVKADAWLYFQSNGRNDLIFITNKIVSIIKESLKYLV